MSGSRRWRRALGVSAPSVSKWSQRFDREGLDGLKDQPGRGAKPSIPLATVRRVVEEAGKAPPGRQRWSTRSLAQEVGISAHSVARIWQSQGLKPHRLRTFKVSRDKKFEHEGVTPSSTCYQRAEPTLETRCPGRIMFLRGL